MEQDTFLSFQLDEPDSDKIFQERINISAAVM